MSDERLIGRWTNAGSSTGELTTIEFEERGALTYVIHSARREQKIFLRYRTEGNVIISNQPSDPREERTIYEITSDGRLILNYAGEKTTYRRARD